MRLFDTFLAREIARIARGVEIRNVTRRMEEVLTEMEGLQIVIAQGETANWLHEMHLARQLSQIDERHLHKAATALLKNVREYMFPAILIWYPEVVESLRSDGDFMTWIDQLALNASLDPTVPVSSWIGSGGVPFSGDSTIDLILKTALDELDFAQNGDVGPGDDPKLLTIAIPKPPEIMPDAEFYEPGSRTMDALRARQFWRAFYTRSPDVSRHVPITILPGDLYGSGSSTQGLLRCNEVSAVVRRIGFTFGHVDGFTNADGPGGLNEMLRYLGGATPREQLFITPAGWTQFTLAEETPFDGFEGRAGYGFNSSPAVSINNHNNSAPPTGLSPFGTYHLDVWSALYSGNGWFQVETEHDKAQDITMVLEVDRRVMSQTFRAPGIASCIPTAGN
jgi:hypothetical protein